MRFVRNHTNDTNRSSLSLDSNRSWQGWEWICRADQVRRYRLNVFLCQCAQVRPQTLQSIIELMIAKCLLEESSHKLQSMLWESLQQPTYHRIWMQQLDESCHHPPPVIVVPDRTLEVVTHVEEQCIAVALSQLLHRVKYARNARNAGVTFLRRLTLGRSFRGFCKSAKPNHRYYSSSASTQSNYLA